MVLSMLRSGVRPLAAVLERNLTTPVLKGVNFEAKRNLTQVCKCSSSFLPAATHHQTLQIRGYSKHGKHQAETKKKYKPYTDSESDSDWEVLGHRGESQFWRRKMRTFHGILDVNKDGVISYDDFKLLADRFVNLGHLSDEHKVDFHKLIKDLWEQQWGEINPYNLVTVEQYLEDMHHVLNDKSQMKRAHSFLPFLFRALDKEKCGVISEKEFKLFFECLGLKEEDATFAFRIIDTNGDGKLTIKEFVTHGRDFFFTEDEERISKYFWGPLVDH